MWAVDRTNLIILGVVLGIVLVVGVVLWMAPKEQGEAMPSTISGQPLPTASMPGPEEPDPAVAAQPDPEPSPQPAESPLLVPAIDGVIQTGEYAHALESGGFRVFWSNDDMVLHLGLLSPGTGYVAIGLDPDQRMRGANYILGAVRGDGQLDMRDDYGTGLLRHEADDAIGGRDDILEAAGREVDGQTMIEFVIPLDSGDPFDKPLRPGETYTILVAFHNTDDSFSAMHSQRGSGEIQLDRESP
jgi:hypothetical protein